MLPKIDLTLLKKLVSELETSLDHVDELQKDPDYNKNNSIVELSKAIGLVSGIFSESSMLIMDIQVLTQKASGLAPKEDSVQNLLTLLKTDTKLSGKN